MKIGTFWGFQICHLVKKTRGKTLSLPGQKQSMRFKTNRLKRCGTARQSWQKCAHRAAICGFFRRKTRNIWHNGQTNRSFANTNDRAAGTKPKAESQPANRATKAFLKRSIFSSSSIFPTIKKRAAALTITNLNRGYPSSMKINLKRRFERRVHRKLIVRQRLQERHEVSLLLHRQPQPARVASCTAR